MRRKAQEWIYNLSDEDITFIKNFVMSSGSLKEVAKLYHITYPTVRLRLDRLIQKMQMNDQIENDAYISLIKKMVIDDQLDFDTAKIYMEVKARPRYIISERTWTKQNEDEEKGE